jgi:hypothetical protein
MKDFHTMRLYSNFCNDHLDTLKYLYNSILYSDHNINISFDEFCTFVFDQTNKTFLRTF